MSVRKTPKKKYGKKKNISKVASKVASGGLQPEPNDQDIQRRIGSFRGAGEPSRKGGRKGIVGQTPKQSKTDQKS